MFRVNQKVVCVDDRFGKRWHQRGILQRPIKGRVYTVRDVGIYNFAVGPMPSLRLEEIINPIIDWDDGDTSEIAFHAGRFRPAVERKTDISFAHEILRKASKRVRA